MSRRSDSYVKPKGLSGSAGASVDAPVKFSLPKPRSSTEEAAKKAALEAQPEKGAQGSSHRRHRRKPHATAAMSETGAAIASESESSEKMPPLVRDVSAERQSVSGTPKATEAPVLVVTTLAPVPAVIVSASASVESDVKPKTEVGNPPTVSVATGLTLFGKSPTKAALPKSESVDGWQWDDEDAKAAADDDKSAYVLVDVPDALNAPAP